MTLFDHLSDDERAIAEIELNDWTDRQPAPEMPVTPTCGNCTHFEVRDIDGIRGVCRAKTYRDWDAGRSFLTLNPEREVTDEPCDRYMEAVPF
jgi:hypothetical protein